MSLIPLAIAAFAGTNSWAANQVLVKFAVDGLPSGLTVGVAGGFMNCPPSGQPFLIPSANVQLTEEFITIYEKGTLANGRVGIRTRFIPTGHYSGDITVIPPDSNGCTGNIPLDTFGYFYSVAGENADGDPKLRSTRQLFPPSFSGQSTVQIQRCLEGRNAEHHGKRRRAHVTEQGTISYFDCALRGHIPTHGYRDAVTRVDSTPHDRGRSGRPHAQSGLALSGDPAIPGLEGLSRHLDQPQHIQSDADERRSSVSAGCADHELQGAQRGR